MAILGLFQVDVDEVVERILSRPKYQTPPEGFWDRLIARGAAWIGSLLSGVVDFLGGPVVAGILALLLLMSLVGVAVLRISRRRAARLEDRLSLDRLLEEGLDPAELERMAAEAEAAGDFTRAVRARFLAGLLHLDRGGRIRYAKGTTTGQLAEQVGSPVFDRLADDHDEIVYGGRAATEEDLARAVEGWRALRQSSRREAPLLTGERPEEPR